MGGGKGLSRRVGRVAARYETGKMKGRSIFLIPVYLFTGVSTSRMMVGNGRNAIEQNARLSLRSESSAAADWLVSKLHEYILV